VRLVQGRAGPSERRLIAALLFEPQRVSWALRVETAIGKTGVAVRAAAAAATSGLQVVYLVPRHDLGEELVGPFAAAGATATVYRGYEADDPTRPEDVP
jgi:hypothetical protein